MRGEIRFLVSLAATTALTAAAGCALLSPTQKKTTGAAAGTEIRLGMVASFSGTSAENGESSKNGAQMAIDKINAAGGVLGKQLKLETKDDQSDRAPAVKAANDLYSSGIQVVLGTNASGSTAEVLLQAAKVRGALLISGSATSPALTDPAQIDGGGWFYRTVPNDALQGTVMADLAKDAGHKKLAVIYVDSPYGTGFAKKLEAAFAAGGGTITLHIYTESAQPKATYNEVVTAALAGAPDGVVMIAYPGEASVMINDWQASGKAPATKFYFGDALQSQSFIDNVTNKSVMEGLRGTAPYTSPKFVEAFKAKFNKTPQFDAGGNFDAVAVVALAMEAAKSEGAAAIKAKLREVSTGGTKYGPDQLKEALEAIRAGKDVDYDGYGGSTDFDERGDVTSGEYEIWTVKNGQVVASGETRKPKP